MSKEFVEKLGDLIEKYFGGSQQEETTKEITKSVEEEQRIALFVVLEPQEGDTTTDLHQDTYTEVEVAKACRNFNQHCNKANLFHKVETQDAEIIESYILPADINLDGEIVKAGSWIQKWYFPETEIGEILWQGVKDGTFNGVSIQARANTEKLEEN